MFKPQPRHRSGSVVALLLLFAFPFVTAAIATADQITYSISDYPQAEIDVLNGHQDKVSGTLIASATGSLVGSYTAGHFGSDNPNLVTLTYSIKNESSDTNLPYPSITFTGSESLGVPLGSGTATFTDTSILLDGYLGLNGPDANGSAGWLIWRSDISHYSGQVTPYGYGGAEIQFVDDPAIHMGIGAMGDRYGS
jgi:hypothetical protein